MQKNRKIKILRIITRLNIGGPAIQAVTLNSGLPRDGFNSLLVCGKMDKAEGDMTYLAREKGVTPIFISELGREISITDDVKAFIAIRRIARQFRPDIIHTHMAKAGTIGRMAAISLKWCGGSHIKLVHTFHGHIFHSYFGEMKSRLFIFIERFLAMFTDKIIAISPSIRGEICHRYRIAGSEKVSTIPLGFNLNGYRKSSVHANTATRPYLQKRSENKISIGIIGRLTKIKNHRLLLDAIQLLKEKGKADLFNLLIVGDGELREELENDALKLGVRGMICFTGWQKDVKAIYNELDIVVMTSFNEGTPVSLIEAMAAAKPVIATDVGGVRDLMGKIKEKNKSGFNVAENGLLVPSSNKTALANALLFIQVHMKNAVQMGKNGQAFVLRMFTEERLLVDIEKLYQGLVKHH